jgi:uncharacterized lipoprotein YmbA
MKLTRIGWSIVMLSCMAACRSVPTRLYTLQALATPAPARSYEGPPIRVDSVHVPSTLDRMELVTAVSVDEWRVHDLDRWSAPLPQLMQQALTADLLSRLPAGKVIFPHTAKPQDAIGLHVDILEFEMSGQRASLRVSWKPGQSVVLQDALVGDDPSALPRVLSDLIAQLADLVATAP